PLCAVDLDEHLTQVPFVAQPPTTTAQLVRILLPEPVAPGPDRLIGHVDTTFEHQLLHVAEAQREPVVQPDAMTDDLGRKPEPLIRRACSGHDRRSCPTSPSRLTNVTVPAGRFLAAFGAISSHFRPRRHRLSAPEYRQVMAGRFAAWHEVTGTAAPAVAA